MSDSDSIGDEIRQLLRSGGDLSAIVADAYKAMSPSARKQVLLVEYRCRTNRCLLLHAWQSPQGTLYYKPPYKLSPTRTKTDTAASARQKRTSDGDRRWLSRAGALDEDLMSDETVALSLQCDHVVAVVRSMHDLWQDVKAASPGRPSVAFL